MGLDHRLERWASAPAGARLLTTQMIIEVAGGFGHPDEQANSVAGQRDGAALERYSGLARSLKPPESGGVPPPQNTLKLTNCSKEQAFYAFAGTLKNTGPHFTALTDWVRHIRPPSITRCPGVSVPHCPRKCWIQTAVLHTAKTRQIENICIREANLRVIEYYEHGFSGGGQHSPTRNDY